jgi:hypothetical protein
MMQSVTRNAMRTLWLCHAESPVKKGMASLKAGIQAKLEAHQQPHKLVNSNTGQVTGEVPDTGPGTENWVWDSKDNMVDMSKAESDHLREGYDAILDSKGFPALLSIGVSEVAELLTRWSAEVKPDSDAPAEDPPASE